MRYTSTRKITSEYQNAVSDTNSQWVVGTGHAFMLAKCMRGSLHVCSTTVHSAFMHKGTQNNQVTTHDNGMQGQEQHQWWTIWQERKPKDYAFRHQFIEKPSMISDCPGMNDLQYQRRAAVHSTDSRGLRWSLAVSGRGGNLWFAGRARSYRHKTINHSCPRSSAKR